MALWYCLSCTAGYAVGLTTCPQCGATEHEEEHEHMAKITSVGPSYEPGKDPNQPDAEPEPADAAPAPESAETDEGQGDGEPQQNPEGVPDGQADGDGHELPPPPPPSA